jgi:hypothetical protein
MKTTRFYKLLILVLVILNITTVFFLWKSSKHGPPHGPRKSLVEVLELKGNKASQIKNLEEIHFRDKDALMEKSRRLHENLFKSFNDATKDSADISMLIDKIVENQREIEQMTFDYFKSVNALCNNGQKEKLHEVIHDALARMGIPPPHPKK